MKDKKIARKSQIMYFRAKDVVVSLSYKKILRLEVILKNRKKFSNRKQRILTNFLGLFIRRNRDAGV